MPVGMLGKGLADVTIDKTVNTISGSAAKGGEGAIEFLTDGEVSGQVRALVWNEQGTDNQVDFKLQAVDPDTGEVNGDIIAAGGLTVPANSKGIECIFNIGKTTVESNERWAIVAKVNKDDGAYLQCVSNNKPLIKVMLTFNELTTTP